MHATKGFTSVLLERFLFLSKIFENNQRSQIQVTQHETANKVNKGAVNLHIYTFTLRSYKEKYKIEHVDSYSIYSDI